jgi:hypothetical protein
MFSAPYRGAVIKPPLEVVVRDCIEFDAKLQVDELRHKIETEREHIPIFFPPEEEEYYANDPSFMLIHKNIRQSIRLNESSHHNKLYGQRLIIAKYDRASIEKVFYEMIMPLAQ